MRDRNKQLQKMLTAILLVCAMVFTGCAVTDQPVTDKSAADLEKQLESLIAENEALKQELAKYTQETVGETSGEQEVADAESSATSTEKPAETETASETLPAEPAESEKLKIVVFGDSIWDMDRSEKGIAGQVAQYMNADVYNCAIGGTRATLKDGESPDMFDTWDSTSLMGMCNTLAGKVDPEFLDGYPAGGVIRQVDPKKVDYYILSYGLNDYFSNAPINTNSGDTMDPHGYGGALRNATLLLSQISPEAKILIISPTYCQFYKNGYMYTDSNMKDYGHGSLTKYANAAQNVAEMTNSLYIDAYSTMGINIYSAEKYLADGIHLTPEGETLYARAVSSCLKYGKPGQVSGNSVYY